MGQCAVVPPSYADHLDGKNKLLAAHRPDRPSRWILDLEEVDGVFQIQGEEMVRRDRQMDEDNNSVASFIGNDNSASRATTPPRSVGAESVLSESTAGVNSYATGIKTETDVTALVTNRDRYAASAKKKLKKRVTERSGRSRRRRGSNVPKSRLAGIDENSLGYSSDSSSSRRSRSSSPSSSRSSRSRRRSREKQPPPSEQPSPTEKSWAYKDMEFLMLLTCGQGGLAESKSSDLYTGVLYLQMKANFMNFYRNQYLAIFPDSPIPRGLSSSCDSVSGLLNSGKQRGPPNLLRISSDSSFSATDRSIIDFSPGVPAYPVSLMVDGSSFMDLAVTGSLGLVDRRGGHNTSTLVDASLSKQKSPDHYIVLIHRRSGAPLAVCALKSPYGPPVVRIFATKQRVFGQSQAATTDELGLKWCSPLPLYAWAEIVAEGEFPMQVNYTFYMASGSGGVFEKVPSYKASHVTTGSPDILVEGRTQFEKNFRGCAVVSITADGGDASFALSIARGVDPSLFICFAAIADEFMEKCMRLQCDVHIMKKSKRYR